MDESQSEKKQALFVRPWELFGFGCHFAWIVFLVVDPTTLAGYVPAEVFPFARLAMAAGIAVSYTLLFFACRALKGFAMKRQLVLAGGVVGLVGTMLLFIPASSAVSLVLCVVSGLCIGFSYSLSMTAGNFFWTKNRPERSVMQLCFSCVVALFVYGILSLLPPGVALALACALPLAGDVILSISKGGKRRPLPLVEKPLAISDRFRMIAYASVYMGTNGVLLGFIQSAGVGALGGSTVVACGLGVGAVVSLVISLRSAPADWLVFLDKASFPLMLCGLAGLACFSGSAFMASACFCAIFLCGFMLSDHFFWVLNGNLAYRDRKDWAQAIVAAMGALQWTAFAIGSFLAVNLGAKSSGVVAAVVLFAAFAALLFARSVIFRQEDAHCLIFGRDMPDAEDARELKCAATAQKYALSPREIDVFMLLAQGRTSTYIQENLMLSQSTVKTHVRHIYRKLNVANKQEMLDLIEQEKL